MNELSRVALLPGSATPYSQESNPRPPVDRKFYHATIYGFEQIPITFMIK